MTAGPYPNHLTMGLPFPDDMVTKGVAERIPLAQWATALLHVSFIMKLSAKVIYFCIMWSFKNFFLG